MKIDPSLPSYTKIKNIAFYHASPPEFLFRLERVVEINYSITFNWSIKDQVEGTTEVQVDPYSFTCFKVPADEAAKHNCSQLRNTNARAELPFARLSTPEQVRAAHSASLEDFTPSQHTRELLHSLWEPQEGFLLLLTNKNKGRLQPVVPVDLSGTLKASGLVQCLRMSALLC